MKLAIIAGGKGTRLGLSDIPKPMVPVDGIPLLERQVLQAKRYGITDIYILSGFLSSVIINYFGDGIKWGIRIHHIVEPFPLGTAGAVGLLRGIINERFLVFYGDVMMNLNIQNFITFDSKTESIGTIIVHPNSHPFDSDLVEVDFDNRVTNFLPKPHAEGVPYQNLVNAAVYILSPKIFEYIEQNKAIDFGKDLFPLLIKKNEKINAYRTYEYIKDLGTKDRYEIISNDVANGKMIRFDVVSLKPAFFFLLDSNDFSKGSRLLLQGLGKIVKEVNTKGFLCIALSITKLSKSNWIEEEKRIDSQLSTYKAYFDKVSFLASSNNVTMQSDMIKVAIDSLFRNINIKESGSFIFINSISCFCDIKISGKKIITFDYFDSSAKLSDYLMLDN